MITQQQIDKNVTWAGLQEFGTFVLSHCVGGNLPDYKKMDLMKINLLVPYIWVWDLRNYQVNNELLVNFAGQKIIDFYGENIIGKPHIFDKRLKIEFPDNPVMTHYHKSIAEKVVAYSKRHQKIEFDTGEVKWKYAESLFFPCSDDGDNINWGVGCVCYGFDPFEGKNIYLHF